MKKAVLIILILIPALITAAIFFFPEHSLSEKENRYLTTRQSLSSDIKDGSFQSDLEQYLSDQFPLRETLVSIQARLRVALGQREIGGAYLCKDGRLMQKITESDIDKNAITAYADRMNRLAEQFPLYVMYVPSAGAINRGELPDGAPMYDFDALYSQLTSRLSGANCVDLRSYLNSPDYYYKTDHHWNTDGAYQAYTAFCAAKGESVRTKESFHLQTVAKDFKGTLDSKVLISKAKDKIVLPTVGDLEVTADGQSLPFYELAALKTKDKYNVFQGGNHGICEIKTENKEGKKLVIFKDSFANSFVPFLTGEYSQIILVDERYTFLGIEDFLNRTEPDEILVLREIIN